MSNKKITLLLLVVFSFLSGIGYIAFQRYEEYRWQKIISEKEAEGWEVDGIFGRPGKFENWYFVHVKRGITYSVEIITDGRREQIVKISPIPPKQESLVAVFQKRGFDLFVVVLR